jgi:peroxiredoxin
MPVLASWYKKYRSKGLTVMGITEMNPTAGEVRRVLRQRGVTYPVTIDRDEKLIKRYGFDAHPDTVVIDRSGKIAHVEIGFVRGDEKTIERAFLPLMNAGGNPAAVNRPGRRGRP